MMQREGGRRGGMGMQDHDRRTGMGGQDSSRVRSKRPHRFHAIAMSRLHLSGAFFLPRRPTGMPRSW